MAGMYAKIIGEDLVVKYGIAKYTLNIREIVEIQELSSSTDMSKNDGYKLVVSATPYSIAYDRVAFKTQDMKK